MSVLRNTSVCGGCRGFVALNNLCLTLLLIIACWGKQAFVEVLGSLAMSHFISLQAISGILVTWPGLRMPIRVLRLLGARSSSRSRESYSTTLGRLQFVWLALIDLVTIRRWEKFTLFGRCDSPSKSRGTLVFHFWEPNTSLPAKWSLQVQKSSTPSSLAIALFRTLEFLVRSVVRWAAQSCSSSFPKLVLAQSPFRYW